MAHYACAEQQAGANSRFPRMSDHTVSAKLDVILFCKYAEVDRYSLAAALETICNDSAQGRSQTLRLRQLTGH
eukprot:SAG31_NODE_2190_length_6229_cov_11.374388_7_plen_73_part_00